MHNENANNINVMIPSSSLHVHVYHQLNVDLIKCPCKTCVTLSKSSVTSRCVSEEELKTIGYTGNDIPTEYSHYQNLKGNIHIIKEIIFSTQSNLISILCLYLHTIQTHMFTHDETQQSTVWSQGQPNNSRLCDTFITLFID